MNIAYANAFYREPNLGGGAVHVAKVIEGFSGLGHQVWVWPGNEHPQASPLPTGLGRLATLRECKALLCRVDYKVPPSSYLKWSQKIMRPFVGKLPLFFEINQIPEYALERGETAERVSQYREAFRHVAPAVTGAICVSEKIAEYFQNLGFRRTICIHNGSDPDHFNGHNAVAPRLAAESSSLKVCWLGSSYSPENRIDLLIATAWRLWEDMETRSQISLHILGDVYDLDGKGPPNLHTHGSIPYRSLPGWLAGMDMGLIMYKNDGSGQFSSPLKLYDYLAAGLTPTGFFHPVTAQLAKEAGLEGELFASETPEALAVNLKGWLISKNLLDSNARKSRDLICKRYSWDHSVQKMIATISEQSDHEDLRSSERQERA